MKLSLAGRLVQAWKAGVGVRLSIQEVRRVLERDERMRADGLDEVKRERAEREARAAASGAHEQHGVDGAGEIW